MHLQHKSDWFPNNRSWNLPTSMGKGTRLISLSHAGSVLAMPAPDCPALSWHQEGMRIHYMFFWKLAENLFRRHLGTWDCKQNHTGSRTHSWNLPTSMGTGTLFISLSHAGRVLAMPGPDCPALSWRQEGGMIIACAFWGRWLSMHSEDILGHGIATHQIDCQALKFETFLPLWAQVHYSSNCPMQAACLQCRRQLTHPVLTWRQEGKNMDHFFLHWDFGGFDEKTSKKQRKMQF